jgi:polyphosphate glucokinase
MDTKKTLCVDIGGTGIKALVVDEQGLAVGAAERVREETPRPATPAAVLEVVARLAGLLGSYDRVSVGFPGVVEDGITKTAPNLDEGWTDFPLAHELEQRLGVAVRVANDAGVQGLGVIEGRGTEVVITLGTGMGFGLYVDGRYVPNIELAHHPLRKGMTYEERVCDAARDELGNKKWKKRVHQVIAQLRKTFNYRVLYVGGGNARHFKPGELTLPEHGQVVVVDNVAGLLGGMRLWQQLTVEHARPGQPGTPEDRE